jgi:EAL domain-containing protein (putative c-di-GMP-specific phosphodiesterase class I)
MQGYLFSPPVSAEEVEKLIWGKRPANWQEAK